jgi:hypothetical protein
MNPAHEIAAEAEATALTGAATDSDYKSDELASLDDFQRASDQRRPVEDLHSLLLRISHHLDYETSERSTIYYRLLAIDGQTKTIIGQTKRRALRGFASYLVAICIGVAGTFAWQSYGEATKQIIATRAPELGWSPEIKQMIADWVQQLGWKPLVDPEITAVRLSVPEQQASSIAQTAQETVAPKAPVAASLDPDQLQQITGSLTVLRQTVEQLAAGQDQIAREITRLHAADLEILQRIPAPSPQLPPAPARKPTPKSLPMPLPSSRTPALPR